MTEEEQRWHRLLARVSELLGQEEAATLMEHLPSRPWHELATKQDLERFATKQDLERFATKQDLERFATKHDLERFATKQDLERFAIKQDLERFATKQDLSELKYELVATMHKELSANTRTLFYSQLATMMTLAALAFGAARL